MSQQPRLWILGAGGHAKVVLAAAESAGFRIAGLLDDRAALLGTFILGHRVDGPIEALDTSGDDLAVVAVGDNATRLRIAGGLPSVAWATVVDASATVHGSVVLGPGTVVFAGAVVQPDCILGQHVILNTACSVDHDGRVGDGAHVGPGARLAGGVDCGEGALVGVGALVAPLHRVGAWSVVGAGSTVLGDVAPGAVVAGTPARPLAARPFDADAGDVGAE